MKDTLLVGMPRLRTAKQFTSTQFTSTNEKDTQLQQSFLSINEIKTSPEYKFFKNKDSSSDNRKNNTVHPELSDADTPRNTILDPCCLAGLWSAIIGCWSAL